MSVEMSKLALITGITGQDGSYLAELLLEKGYEVYGLVRRLSTPNTTNINHIIDQIHLIEGDLLDQTSLNTAVKEVQPDEVYNLAAQSFVGTAWTQPVLTGEITGLGACRVFESVRRECPTARVYQASSSEMFGKVQETPQNEKTPFYPRSPYGAAKLYAHWLGVNYRESYNLYISNGILFNHESPRRGMEFVTRKITDGVARIAHGVSKELRLGNIDSKRDWGYAGDYVKAMWMMLQQEKPDDYVIATGESHSIKEFLDLAFREAGMNWKDYVVQDQKFMRPAEVEHLKGDYTKAKKVLGWEPEISFGYLVKMMVEADMGRWDQKLHNI
jgi:GDPmannose 4,6-dehydratase